LLALVLGLGIRAAYLPEVIHAPDFTAPILDPQLNDYWARALVSGDWNPPDFAEDPCIRTAPYGRPPGYPHLLATIYWLTGEGYLAPRVVQMLAGLINVFLAYRLALALFGATEGALAALLMATYWAFVYFEGELNDPVFTVFLGLTSALCLVRWAREGKSRWAFAAGAILGAFALFRPNVLLVVAVLAVWLARRACRRGRALRPAALAVSLFVGGAALVIAPAIIRNYLVSKELILISSYGGVNAYIGNNRESDGTSAEIPDLMEIVGMRSWDCFSYPALVRRLSRNLSYPRPTFSGVSRYFYGRAWDFVSENPVAAVKLALRKTLLFWGPAEISDSKVIHEERVHSRILRHLPGFPLALSLFVLGLVVCLVEARRPLTPDAEASWSRGGVALLTVGILAYFLSVLPFFMAGRYRVPVIPFLLVVGAYGGGRLVRWAGARRYAATAALGAVWIVAYAVASLPLVPYTADRSMWHLRRAQAYSASGDRARAQDELYQALEANPHLAEAHLLLGYMLAESGDAEGAMHRYRQAIEAEVKYALAYNNLGYELARAGSLEEAERNYVEALRLDPYFTLAHNNLGNLLTGMGRLDEAEAHYRAVLEADPEDRFAHYNLANLWLRRGERDAAAAEFVRAVANSPRDPDVLNDYGLFLAGGGHYEEAMRYYREALRIDPTHVKAHFNLGNVLGETGRFDGAMEQLGKAIELDPAFEPAIKNMEIVKEAKRQALQNRAPD